MRERGLPCPAGVGGDSAATRRRIQEEKDVGESNPFWFLPLAFYLTVVFLKTVVWFPRVFTEQKFPSSCKSMPALGLCTLSGWHINYGD